MTSFLFNNAIVDIPDPDAALKAAGLPIEAEQAKTMNVQQLYATVKQAFITNPHLARNSAKHVRALGALILLRLDANAALAVPKPGATNADDVFVDVRKVEDTTMAHLQRLQDQGLLTFPAVQIAIWSKAA